MKIFVVLDWCMKCKSEHFMGLYSSRSKAMNSIANDPFLDKSNVMEFDFSKRRAGKCDYFAFTILQGNPFFQIRGKIPWKFKPFISFFENGIKNRIGFGKTFEEAKANYRKGQLTP